MGDAAGIGPELLARAWLTPELHTLCQPLLVGSVARLRASLSGMGAAVEVRQLGSVADAHWSKTSPTTPLECWEPAGAPDVAEVIWGRPDARAGQAAHDYLVAAIDVCLARTAHGIVTAPLHKGSLHAAKLPYPGHTEILAERTGTQRFAMMLYGAGVGVAHVTLHLALRDVFTHLSTERIYETIELVAETMERIDGRPARIGVFGLNPHAGDGGLFGDEEQRLIAPAVVAARKAGIEVTGPWPSDTLFGRARRGEFNGLVALYHDQGHIGMKLLAGYQAVNLSLGLPILRTSVAHGTAFDIAGQFHADPTSLLEAVRVAARLARTCPPPGHPLT